jgi:uncharacterized protein (DUF2237 family)
MEDVAFPVSAREPTNSRTATVTTFLSDGVCGFGAEAPGRASVAATVAKEVREVKSTAL